MTYKITFDAQPNSEDIQLLSDGIVSYANKMKGHKAIEPFAFFIRDENEKIKGGLNGVIFYGCLHIDQLYIDESLRKQGYGTRLMQSAEKLAKEKHCPFVTVNTMDWEALGFYEKLGYSVEFARHGYAKESVFYFLRKELMP